MALTNLGMSVRFGRGNQYDGLKCLIAFTIQPYISSREDYDEAKSARDDITTFIYARIEVCHPCF